MPPPPSALHPPLSTPPPSPLHPPPIAVLLMNYGGPERPEDCEAYIRNVFADPDLIPIPNFLRRPVASLAARRRAPYLRANYEAMGSMSPIREQTESQAEALQAVLGEGFLCRVGMRYWEPSIATALQGIREAGCRRLVLLPLYPQESRSTTGSSVAEVRRCLVASGYEPEVFTVGAFWDDPGFQSTLASSVREALATLGPGARILFSAHGLPLSAARGDRYPGQVESTVRALMEHIGWAAPYALAWQSKVGPARWLEPSVTEVLRRWSAEGVTRVVLVPVVFVSEHSETLYELDVLYAGQAREMGMEVLRVPTPRVAPPFIRGLAGLVRRAVGSPA